MCSTQKDGTFAVVEARNAPCPMEWGCPKDRSMTVVTLPKCSNSSGPLQRELPSKTGFPSGNEGPSWGLLGDAEQVLIRTGP